TPASPPTPFPLPDAVLPPDPLFLALAPGNVQRRWEGFLGIGQSRGESPPSRLPPIRPPAPLMAPSCSAAIHAHDAPPPAPPATPRKTSKTASETCKMTSSPPPRHLTAITARFPGN